MTLEERAALRKLAEHVAAYPDIHWASPAAELSAAVPRLLDEIERIERPHELVRAAAAENARLREQLAALEAENQRLKRFYDHARLSHSMPNICCPDVGDLR